MSVRVLQRRSHVPYPSLLLFLHSQHFSPCKKREETSERLAVARCSSLRRVARLPLLSFYKEKSVVSVKTAVGKDREHGFSVAGLLSSGSSEAVFCSTHAVDSLVLVAVFGASASCLLRLRCWRAALWCCSSGGAPWPSCHPSRLSNALSCASSLCRSLCRKSKIGVEGRSASPSFPFCVSFYYFERLLLLTHIPFLLTSNLT